MLCEVFMPKYGLTMKEGTIGTWYKKEGDRLQKGEIIVEAMSEKIINDIESPATGVLEKIIAQEGDIVAVGAVIAIIAADHI